MLSILFFFLIVIFNLPLLFSFLKQKKILLIFFILFFNLLFSQSKPIAFYSMVKIFQFLFIAYFFYETKIDNFLILFSFLLITLIEFFLALHQIKSGHSFDGVFYFLGERHINLAHPSIAKVIFFDQQLLRPYGTFSHPNSLAGFYLLLYTFILTQKNFDNYQLLKNILLFLSTVLIFLSFSKVVIFVFLLINILFYFKKIRSCPLCFLTKIITIFTLSFLFLFSKGDLLSLQKRTELIFQSLRIIGNHPFFGVGLGNYLFAQKNFSSSFPLFFNQPVHNIFLLFLAEVGIPVFILLIFFAFIFFKKNFKKISFATYSLLLATFLTGFFDHYWLTLKQNFLLTAVIFGLTFQELKRS